MTSDSLIVEGIAGVDAEDATVVPIDKVSNNSIRVLATCHSLVQLDDDLVGDPLEKATLQAIDWTLTKGEAVIPKKGAHPAIKIFHRHHFSSSLKRMSVVAGYTQQMHTEPTYVTSVKGAPETLKPMFKSIPENYDKIYMELSRRGARVLALGIKELGSINPSKARDLSREDLECDLVFSGFVVISCPLKSDSKSVIKELINASHHVVMITGDNPLTACHVAKELRFTRHKATLILNGSVWKSVNEEVWIPATVMKDKKEWKEVVSKYDLCLTGDGLTHVRNELPECVSSLLPYVRVFARFDPKQKEFVITTLKETGFTVLMCGDGTNDVGALKHADVGVAILSSIPTSHKEDRSRALVKKEGDKKTTELNKTTNKKLGKRPGASDNSSPQARLNRQQQKLQELLKEMEETERAQIVKLGDASIAAPFTSKTSSIVSINHVIKQGRCTLVTTLQMFKILALNALILAYSQSVLYLEGVKFSDGQATLQGILLAACFLFISRSKPLKTLSKQRPLPNIFNLYTISTVLLQFAVHFGCLFYLVQQAMLADPR